MTSTIVDALRKIASSEDFAAPMEAITGAMGFRYYALPHHDDLRQHRTARVDLHGYASKLISNSRKNSAWTISRAGPGPASTGTP